MCRQLEEQQKSHEAGINRLIEENLGLVNPIATAIRRRLPPRFELDDLVQAGRVGLVVAARNYDPSLMVPFACYVRKRIRGAMLDAVRTDRIFGPYGVRAKQELLSPHLLRTSEPVGHLDMLGLESAGLSAQEQRVLELIYVEGQTPAGIGRSRVLHIGRQRVEQLHHQALHKLRHTLRKAA